MVYVINSQEKIFLYFNEVFLRFARFSKKYYVNKVDSFYWTQIKLSAHTLVGLFLRKCFGEKLDTVVQNLLDLFQLIFLR